MQSSYGELKQQAWQANLEIPRRGLAIYTFGNVSALDAERGVFAIKPSGVEYERLAAADMVVVDLDSKVVEGTLRPSSDTKTHAALYRAFQGIGGTGIRPWTLMSGRDVSGQGEVLVNEATAAALPSHYAAEEKMTANAAGVLFVRSG